MYNIHCGVPARLRSDIKIYLQTDAGNKAMSGSKCLPFVLRDWSLIKGMGATKREEGGQLKFYPYERRKGRKSFSHAEGGVARKVLG